MVLYSINRMKKASDIVTLIEFILISFATWTGILPLYEKWHSVAVFIIAGIVTLLRIVLLIVRQIIVNRGVKDSVVTIGFITFFLLGIIGGGLTIMYGVDECGIYKVTASKETKQEPVKQTEYIGSETTQIKIGDEVFIKHGYYDSEAKRRFSDNTLAIVEEIKGSSVKLRIKAGSSSFITETKIENVLLKVENPEYKEAEKKKKLLELGLLSSTDLTTEYLYIKPNQEYKLGVGSVVLIKNDFYAETIHQRIKKDTLCEVKAVDGNNVLVLIKNNNLNCEVNINSDNLLLRIDNPFLD